MNIPTNIRYTYVFVVVGTANHNGDNGDEAGHVDYYCGYAHGG